MDKINNPFSPGAGSPPPELAGRHDILEEAQTLLGRIKKGRPEKSMLLTGLRGVGKTVLLNTIEKIAQETGYHTIFIEAHSDKSLAALLAPHLRRLLYKLNSPKNKTSKTKLALTVLKTFANAVQIKVGDIELGLDIEGTPGIADTGDLELDLPDLLIAIAEAAQEQDTPVAILIDEIQYFNTTELSSLIMAMHKMQQKALPLILLGAGLPILPGLAGDSKSYAERLLNFPIIGAPTKNRCQNSITRTSSNGRRLF